jgi:hypothetical protein
MRISEIELADAAAIPGHVRVQALVSYDDRRVAPEMYWVELPQSYAESLGRSGSPWVLAMLPLAATLGEPLTVDHPVDPMLFEGIREIMQLWRYWFPAMHVVELDADQASLAVVRDRTAVGQFFSGGVDSFFTALRHAAGSPSRSDAFLFVWGFDIALEKRAALDTAVAGLRRAADGLGRALIIAASNIRKGRAGTVPWATLGHGLAMGQIGLHLEHAFTRILIPSTDGYRETGPWGSHVLLDHLMSTSNVRFIHDGPSFTRLEKVRLIAASPPARSTLRICWKSDAGTNCGRCEKCLRTLIALELLGVFSACQSFEDKHLDLDRVRRIYCPQKAVGSLKLYYDDLLSLARDVNRVDIEAALRSALSRSKRWAVALGAIAQLQRLPVAGRLAERLGKAIRSRLIY